MAAITVSVALLAEISQRACSPYETSVGRSAIRLARRAAASGDHGAGRTEGAALGRQFVDAAVRAQCMDFIVFGMTREHVEGRGADRAGGAQDGNALH